MESLFHAVAVLAVLFVGFQQGAVVAVRPYTSVLTVPNGQRWGTWRCPEMCPDQYFAIGFSTRVESKQRKGDDTAMNGIRLICGKDGNHNSIHTVESHPGFWGDWSNPQYCPSGVLSSFQLRVEGRQGMFGDDTAVNNIRFRCSSSPELEGPGQNWGDYGGWSQVCVNGAICGIETKVEERQGSGDNTALNDVRFRCCARAQQVRTSARINSNWSLWSHDPEVTGPIKDQCSPKSLSLSTDHHRRLQAASRLSCNSYDGGSRLLLSSPQPLRTTGCRPPLLPR